MKYLSNPLPLSANYSFRYNGRALRIYHGTAFEQVTLQAGGSFSWSDDGKGYSLVFTKNVHMDDKDNIAGEFEFTINDPLTGESTSSVSIGI